MFTRYNVPKNYSGNRFSVNQYETETKTHSAQGSKTSFSPSFNQEKTNTPSGEIENSPFFTVDNDDSTEEIRENDLNNDIVLENEILEDDNESKNDNEAKDNSALNEFKSSFLSLFNGIKKDDLMLIFLIILLSNEENPTPPLLLALLLLYS